jgi:hypothetical protein
MTNLSHVHSGDCKILPPTYVIRPSHTMEISWRRGRRVSDAWQCSQLVFFNNLVPIGKNTAWTHRQTSPTARPSTGVMHHCLRPPLLGSFAGRFGASPHSDARRTYSDAASAPFEVAHSHVSIRPASWTLVFCRSAAWKFCACADNTCYHQIRPHSSWA